MKKRRYKGALLSFLMAFALIFTMVSAGFTDVFAQAPDDAAEQTETAAQTETASQQPEATTPAEESAEAEAVLESEDTNYVFSIDGSINGNVITYNVNNTSVTVTIDSTKATLNGNTMTVAYTGASTNNTANILAALNSAISNITSFDANTMEVALVANDGFTGRLTYSNGTLALAENGTNLPDNTHFVIRQKTNNQPPGPQTQTNARATINYTGTITGQIDPYRPEGPIAVCINGGPIVPVTSGQATAVDYNLPDNATTVDIEVVCIHNYIPDSISIDGVQKLSSAPDKQTLLNNYSGQVYHFRYTVNKAANDTYAVAVNAHEATSADWAVGNFLWTYTDQNAGDDYVGHASLDVVSVTYRGETITSPGARTSYFGGATEWSNDRTSGGSATLPAGAIIRVKLTPDFGYQLVSFGVNGGQFAAQETPCEYTFEVKPGNFHLAANFRPVENQIMAEAGSVDGGSISFGANEATMSAGTARLDIVDANVSEGELSEMANAASGYVLGDCMDISLTNVIYKGRADDTWDTPVTTLNSEATVSLKLAKAPAGNQVIVVHQNHDGSVETKDATYDPATQTVSFATSGFSKYAIAFKGSNDAVNEAEVGNVINNLYRTILGREADAAGFADWSNQVKERKISGAQLITGFVNSPEFVSKQTSNTDYVKTLYKCFFDRVPSDDEIKYWVDKLDGGASRNEVMAGFVNSKEFTATCDSMNVSRGTMDSDGSIKYNEGVYRFVQRCYGEGLARKGEIEGVEDWTYRINSGAMTPKSVAQSFIASEEFKNKNLDNEEYVKTLYRMFLGREAEEEGLRYWVDKLQGGTSREELVGGFSDSKEFSGIMASYGV